jgi:hypothetical protein
MDRIWKELGNPVWWFSVVAAGLALNIAAAYLKTWLDKLLSGLSRTFRLRNQRQRQARYRRIEQMKTHDSEMQFRLWHEQRSCSAAIYATVYGLGLGLTASFLIALHPVASMGRLLTTALLSTGCGLIFIGFQHWMTGLTTSLEIREAFRRRSEHSEQLHNEPV